VRRALLVTLTAALALAAPAAAQGPSAEKVTIPMEPRTIAVVSDLLPGDRALELYRSLIPAGYEMPAKPQVAVYLGEPNVPVLVPGQPYNEYSRWIEGPISIKVRRGAEEGYFPLAMPVSSQFEYDLGRAAGLPKILVTGEFTETENGFATEARAADRVLMRLEWRRERSPMETPLELEKVIAFRYPLLTLNPALQGRDLFSVKFTPNPPPDPTQAPIPPIGNQPEPEIGIVRVKLDPNPLNVDPTLPDLLGQRGATLADLVPLEQELPGAYARNPILLDIETKKIGDGGGYGPGAAPPPAGPASAPPRAPIVLVRRCLKPGRLRVALRTQKYGPDQVDDVRSVRFRFGSRTVGRDGSGPFVKVVSRRVLARSLRGRTLRAEISRRNGARMILTRTLPRCGLRR
jgi:hypothetical protein